MIEEVTDTKKKAESNGKERFNIIFEDEQTAQLILNDNFAHIGNEQMLIIADNCMITKANSKFGKSYAVRLGKHVVGFINYYTGKFDDLGNALKTAEFVKPITAAEVDDLIESYA